MAARARWDVRVNIDGEEMMLTNISARIGKVGVTALQLARRIANGMHGKGHGKDVQVIAYEMTDGAKKSSTKAKALPPPAKPPVSIAQVLTADVLKSAFNVTTDDEETKDESSTTSSN